ncbi:YqgQ family protein [Streptococcus pluranimalium]|uniref:YqgQ family protein n=1 Tax=Streptococcus pluranimalium TaxID=82348 RepID=UPI0039FD65D4
MKTLYDVQQVLKHFGIYVYLGKRLFDIELMKIELARLHDNGLIEEEVYLQAELILRREHRLEIEAEKNKRNRQSDDR